MLRAALLSVTLGLLGGCQSQTRDGRPDTVLRRSGDEWREVSPQRMTRDLQLFVSEFAAEVSGTASEIASSTQDRRIREMSLMWRLKTIPIIETAILIPDPRQALVAMWLITAEQQGYLSEGRGRDIFGDQQHLAIRTADALEARIEEMASRYYTEEQMEAAIRDVQEFEEASPVMAVFDLYDPMAISSGSLDDDGIGGILAAPLSPFRALGGIGDAPTELHRLSLVMLAFSRMVEQQPERIRWHLELLLLNMESGETMTELRRSMDRASTSMASFAETAETLPADLRAEFETALESLDERHERIDQSLQQAMQVSGDLKASSENLARVTTLADERMEDIGELLAKTDETAQVWQSTSQTVNELVRSLDDMLIGFRENRREGAPPFDINDYTRAATEIRSAAADFNALLEDAQSAEFTNLVERLDETSRATIDYAQASMNGVVDRITWRLVIVLGILIGILAVYRILVTKLANQRS